MKLRQRECIKYASDSEEDEASENVVVMNQRMRKVKAGSDMGFSANAETGSLLRYAQPNIKNTSVAFCPSPEMPVIVDDSDEDFMEARVPQRKRSTSHTKAESCPQAKRNISCRSARKSYKELTSSDEDDNQNNSARDAPDFYSFSFKQEVKKEEAQRVLVPGRRCLVKAVSSPKLQVEESPCVLSEEDPEVFSDAEEPKGRRSKRVLSRKACTPITEQQDLTKADANSNSPLSETTAVQEPMALSLHVDAFGLRNLEGASACKMVKRLGQVEKILAVQNRGTDSVVYCIKECGKSYRSVCEVKEALLKSKCPQLLRNFLKRMDELERMNGNPAERENAPVFSPSHLRIERVIGQEERKGGRRYFLVKWCGLPYTEATWELQADLTFKEDQVALDRYVQIHLRSSSGVSTTSSGKLLFKDGRVLREYQEKGLAWMDHNFQNRVNCILADEMGLGKTMQAVSMLQNLRVKRKFKGPFLVIAPVSTLGHWQREVESLTDMNCVVFSGSAEDRRIIKEYEFYYPKSQYVKFNVLLTSFEILMKDQGFLSKQEWQYVVVDEAHRLKSNCSKTTCCLKQLSIRKGGLLLLTGTPIQNNTKEIFSLLNILDSQQFNSEEDFLLKYGDLKNAEQVKDLQDNVLRPRLLRRLKEDVEKSIPLKEETIIWVELTKEQRCYYRAILKNRISDLLKGSQSNNIPNLRNVAMELRKLCNHPFLCNGLQEDLNSKLKLQEADESSKALCMSSGKMMLLEKLLPMLKNAGHRVLLFSQFAIMLDLLEDYLISKNYSYERIDGSVRGSERQAAIDRYSAKDSDTFLFLLSTRAGGLGITLTAADTCIIYDSDWNPQNDLQAMARCHRIGQKKDVRIYRFITKDTYEQHLFECSSRKYGLDEAILGGMQGAITDTDYNANIENLLKKGAYNILREDGEDEAAAFHAQNIEQILESRTEKRLVGGRGQNTFSVATFISNPNADSVLNEEPASYEDPQQFWQELLPEACNAAFNDDKSAVLTSCGPRKRHVVNYREGRGNSEPESSDEEHEASKSRRRSKKKNSQEPVVKDDIKQWLEKEVKLLENWLIDLGANRTEDIMVEAGLQHHGIQQVEQLCDVLIQMCHYFQARDEAVKHTSNFEQMRKNSKPEPDFESAQLVPKGSDCLINQAQQGWNASTFRNTSGVVPTSVDMQPLQVSKDMETSQDGDEKPEFPCVIMASNGVEVKFPTIPPYAQKALRSQAFTKRMEKKASRYLLALKERETLAKAMSEGNIPPIYIKGPKRLPTWWRELEDADLLRGAHKHGHHSFLKIREDKSLCFSSRLDLLKSQREESLPANSIEAQDLPVEPLPQPDQEIWPQDAVLSIRLRQLIQALRDLISFADWRKTQGLEEIAPVPSKRLLPVAQKESSRRPSMELCNRNPMASPPSSNARVQNPVADVGPLPIVKTKSPHVKRSKGKENLHMREILDVPNTSSEGSEDEEFQGRDIRKSSAYPFVSREQVAQPAKAYPNTMAGDASRINKPSKEAGNMSMRSEVGSMPAREDKAYTSVLKEAKVSTQQESEEKKRSATSNVRIVDRAKGNQREPLMELNAAKRKTCIQAPPLSNKKHKEAGKQQTLHGFLAQRSAPKHDTPS